MELELDKTRWGADSEERLEGKLRKTLDELQEQRLCVHCRIENGIKRCLRDGRPTVEEADELGLPPRDH